MKIKIWRVGSELKIDYEGFPGQECEKEDKILKLILARMGVVADDTSTEPKEATVEELEFEREKITN